MQFTDTATQQGVTEQRFELEVSGERVPGILWTPEGARGPRPLVLQGHGGTQHKRVQNVLGLARRLVRHHGYAVAAIDAPGHGDRVAPEEAARNRERARVPGALRMTDEQRKALAQRSQQAVAEWRATLDALQQVEHVGHERPVGYWGVSMGTLFGVPLLAAESRFSCAVLGLAGMRAGAEAFVDAARRVKIPLLFMFQRNDELMTFESGLALFDAFGSEIKTMHVNPGPHMGIPAFEREYFETFFVRYLGTAAEPPGGAA
ncbi:MAG: dienelactone hydrolase family protein [Polyangiales bacterium]